MNNPRIFVISDTHFGETNTIKYFNRPFASAQEMDETMKKRWNSVVRPQDVVIHCGDFCDGKGKHAFTNIIKYRCQLNGRIGLILGNHDNERLNYRDREAFSLSIPIIKGSVKFYFAIASNGCHPPLLKTLRLSIMVMCIIKICMMRMNGYQHV